MSADRFVGNNLAVNVRVSVVAAFTFLVTDIADKSFEFDRVKVALVLLWVKLVVSVDEDRWSVLDILAGSVLANDLPAGLESDIDIAESDSSVFDGLNSSETLPLNGEFLALSASWVNIGNDPNVLSVPDHSLLERFFLKTLALAPWAVA